MRKVHGIMTRAFTVGAALLIAVACESASRATAPASHQSGERAIGLSADLGHLIPQTLPRGVPVPENSILTAGPAPFDPKREGPASPSGVARLSLSSSDLSRLNVLRGPRPQGASKSGVISPSIIRTDAHALYWADSGRGLFGTSDAGRSISIPTGWDSAVVFAPTNLPAGGSCIEITAIHWKTTTYSHPTNSLGFFDWCQAGNWNTIYDLDNSTVRSNYLRSYSDDFGKSRELYWFEIIASSSSASPNSYDCWTAYLYNYSTGYWNSITSICGSQPSGNGLPFLSGWSMHESYYMRGHYSSTCPTYPSVRAGNLQIWNSSGSWVPLDSTSGRRPDIHDGICWTGGTYTFVEGVSTVSQWYGWTPSN